ncbi:MAG: Isoprenyl transferase [Parcubacteria group bacterium GW2011_GWA2_47_8]|nr:MAG: Isoprenyl transferase [Parcubacteria group bacterium GW2011_GWA2_47_8]OHB19366.1 MAG: di-trans,poly-cis-decaprenylcistransferase [Parcubacteria group bacterium RIFCSPHIGHO2_01_FULL_47_10b]
MKHATKHAKTSGVTHLGIIMDGNRRWARAQGLPPFKGHEQGAKTLKVIARACQDRGITIFTVYALSTENLTQRAHKELEFLFGLMKHAFTKELDEFVAQGARIKVLGRREGLPSSLIDVIRHAEDATADCTKGTIQFCINYGGRAEIVDAVKAIGREIANNKRDPNHIDESIIAAHLYNPDAPDPDLIIRTSGEQRVSGFLTWQSVYSELYFTPTPWPAFTTEELDKALDEYKKRSRRFGGS